MNFRLLSSIAIAAGVCAASISHADVDQFSVRYYGVHNQYTDSVPTDDPFYYWSGFVFTDTPNDATSGTITLSNATTANMFFSPPQVVGAYSPFYGDIPALMADYPAGNTLFTLLTGTLAPASATLSVAGEDFPNEIPYLDEGTYSDLQLTPAGVDAPVSWAPFTHDSLHDFQSSQFGTYDMTANASGYDSFGANESHTDITIPGSNLVSGHQYFYNLFFYCATFTSNAGFGGADGYSDYVRQTQGRFKVKADPGTVSGQLILGDSVKRAGEPITVEIMNGNTVAETINITLGLEGWYAFDTALTGSRTIKFRGRHWVKKAVTANLDTGEDYLDFTLQNGDVDASGEVDAADIDVVIANFGSTAGSSGFFDPADVDGSLEVDAADIDIVIANFGAADE